MLRGLDLLPRVAGHVPAFGRLVLERIEVLGLAREQVEHDRVLEQAPRIALAHELGEVGAEQRGEDRVGLGVCERLRDRAGVDLAQRRRLLGDELHARLRLGEQLLEPARRRLAVFVVRVHDRPALLLQLGGVGDQHRGLHVRGRAQAEGVLVAVVPDDLVGERLGGDEQHFLLVGEVRHRQPDVRGEGAHEDLDLLPREQFLGNAHRVAGGAAVVARDHLQLAAVDAAGGVDLVERELPALLVRLKECRECLVAVQLAELDRLRLRGEGGEGEDAGRGKFHFLHVMFPFQLIKSVDWMRRTPAFFMSAQALATEPCRSMPRQASSITAAWKPALRASSAVQATQKSVASPHT